MLRTYVQGTMMQPFYSKNNSTVSNRPLLTINYISIAGLGGSWQHESQSNGRAGTTYVGLFNGNLVHEHVDTAMNGNLDPVSISHYYNSACSDTDNGYFRCGNGWKHSGLQYIRKETISKIKYYVWTDGSGTEHWFKDKGTEEVKDLEGMQFRLTYHANNPSRYAYIDIVDQQHNSLIFQYRHKSEQTGGDLGKWANMWLVRIENSKYKESVKSDHNVKYFYEEGATDAQARALEGKIRKIVDGAGRETRFEYNNQNLLSAITTPGELDGDTNRRRINFLYDAQRNLVGVRYPDMQNVGISTQGHTRFEYLVDGSPALQTNMLCATVNIDGQRLAITYEDRPICQIESSTEDETGIVSKDISESKDQMRRVIALEKISGSLRGGKQLFTYKHMCTDVTAVTGTVSDAGKTISYQFNDKGNVICTTDELGFAVCTKFSETIENTPTEAGKLQKVVINRLRCPDFTQGWGYAWEVVGAMPKCMGMPSVSLVPFNNSPTEQTVWLEGGKTWSLSAYVQTSTDDPIDATYNIAIHATVNGVTYSSIPLTTATERIADDDKLLPTDGWERLHLVFDTPSSSSPVQVLVRFSNERYGAFLSCPQLEEGVVANSFNMLSNADFRAYNQPSGSKKLPVDWSPSSEAASNAEACWVERGSYHGFAFPEALAGGALQLPGNPNISTMNYYQDVAVSGKKNDVFVVGGWANAHSIPLVNNTHFQLTVRFKNSSGTWVDATPKQHSFGSAWMGWQFVSGAVAAPAAYTAIRIQAGYAGNANKAYFTNLFLHREQFGRSFAFDDDKNLLSVGTLAGLKDDAEYGTNRNMTSYKQPGRSDSERYRMEWGSTTAEQKRHLMRSMKTPELVEHIYTYDDCGNKTEETATSSTVVIKGQTNYTADKNYANEQIDARGVKSTTSTNPRIGTLNSSSIPKPGSLASATNPAQVTMSYQYDSADRITSAQTTVDGKTYKNTYSYANDRLQTIRHNTDAYTTNDVTYTLECDGLGRTTNIKVGAKTLSEKVYANDRSSKIVEERFGSGGMCGKKRYQYDAFDRLTDVRFDDEATPRYHYEYGANGQASSLKDTHLNQTQWTEYSLAQQPVQISTRADDTNELLYRATIRYNKYNQIKSFLERVPGKSYKTDYTYDKDNRIKTAVYDEATRKVTYGYDAIGRTQSKTVLNSTSTYNVGYTYEPGSTTLYGAKASSNLIRTITQGSGANAMNLSYTYDALGNILSETRGGYTTTYKYDGLGQLTRVNDPREGATWTYDYDCGGNIQQKKRYAYTTADTPGTILETITYGYNDATWKDKLTTYDGKLIEYNDIGNPETYDGKVFEWEGGRRLKRISFTETTGVDDDDDDGGSAELKIPGQMTFNKTTMEISHTPGTHHYDMNDVFTVGADGQLSASVSGEKWDYDLADGTVVANRRGVTTTVVKTINYSYNESGLRTQKVVTENDVSTATTYTLHGKYVMHLKKGNDELHFFYDAENRPQMVEHKAANGTRSTYIYVHNLQGDMVAMVDAYGSKVVEYSYDAWGKPTSTTDSTATSLGTLNPFRYRGYQYDEETGYYYLRSRYYDPELGRFLNIDEALGNSGKLLSHNTYAYCLNNVTSRTDAPGTSCHEAYPGTKEDWELDFESLDISLPVGYSYKPAKSSPSSSGIAVYVFETSYSVEHFQGYNYYQHRYTIDRGNNKEKKVGDFYDDVMTRVDDALNAAASTTPYGIYPALVNSAGNLGSGLKFFIFDKPMFLSKYSFGQILPRSTAVPTYNPQLINIEARFYTVTSTGYIWYQKYTPEKG